VANEPAGIACGKDCNEIRPFGTALKLRTKSKASHRFVRWQGACQEKKDNCRVGGNADCRFATSQRGDANGTRV
jgi:hypothetical protein